MNNKAEYMTSSHLVIEMVENGFIVSYAPEHPAIPPTFRCVAETPESLAAIVRRWAEREATASLRARYLNNQA